MHFSRHIWFQSIWMPYFITQCWHLLMNVDTHDVVDVIARQKKAIVSCSNKPRQETKICYCYVRCKMWPSSAWVSASSSKKLSINVLNKAWNTYCIYLFERQRERENVKINVYPFYNEANVHLHSRIDKRDKSCEFIHMCTYKFVWSCTFKHVDT